MPSTSIYTRTDGIVHWSACIDSPGPRRENIEVRSSHVGLGVNPAAIVAISDRLAQPDGEWKPFKPNALVRSLYPKLRRVDPAPGRGRVEIGVLKRSDVRLQIDSGALVATVWGSVSHTSDVST